ncbi:MAG TPA: TIGR03435 family protein [Candidatus Acidoferrales bacterium]|nr:TIGR03435 family protein [Candidatus Acidoferrales bacterium]
MLTKFLQAICAGVCLGAVAFAQAQPPAAKLTFEVASVKQAPPLDPVAIMSGKAHVGMKIDAARVDIGSLSLSDLIRIAYKLKSYQLVSPDWMNGIGAQRWDIMAKMPPGANKDQVPEMLQVLLAERFKLEFHRETKEHSAYALTVAKTGLKMKEAPPDSEPAKAEPAPPGADPAPPPGNSNPQIKMTGSGDTRTVTVGGGEAGPMKMTVTPAGMHMEAEKMPMDGLVELLSKLVDKPIVDQTELKGKYHVALDISMAEMMAMARAAGAPVPATAPGGDGKGPADAASDPTSGGSVFTTVQQLGLKLDSRKLPIEILVVEKCEKAPTEN